MKVSWLSEGKEIAFPPCSVFLNTYFPTPSFTDKTLHIHIEWKRAFSFNLLIHTSIFPGNTLIGKPKSSWPALYAFQHTLNLTITLKITVLLQKTQVLTSQAKGWQGKLWGSGGSTSRTYVLRMRLSCASVLIIINPESLASGSYLTFRLFLPSRSGSCNDTT